ncbi:MAG TPA: hypothetical protein VGO25_14625 [Rhodanobacteraceae bacterium]|jgi:hypothetical protein|nr:hypothetical protein [Rhodanobacteraceae bacterium]
MSTADVSPMPGPIMFPDPLNAFLAITELDDASPFFGELFRRKFGDPVPAEKHHFGVFFRAGDGNFVPLSYLHFMPFDELLLVGGLCTDGRTFERMSETQREQIRAAGGVMVHALRYVFLRLADSCEAYFGYCGDPRAYEVDMQAGFVPTEHDKLIARWHKPLDPARRQILIGKAHAIGPF